MQKTKFEGGGEIRKKGGGRSGSLKLTSGIAVVFQNTVSALHA